MHMLINPNSENKFSLYNKVSLYLKLNRPMENCEGAYDIRIISNIIDMDLE